jgi:glycine/D-amino acid oxidase-like deaminating enzyme
LYAKFKNFNLSKNKMYSYWEHSTFLRRADVVIIGSGIVGLNAAIALKQRNASLRVVVVERGTLPTGASTKNAGFACFGSMTELLDDLQTSSEDEVFALAERRWKGLERLRSRIGDDAMDYETLGGFEVFSNRGEDAVAFAECSAQIHDFNRKMEAITASKTTYSIENQAIAGFGLGDSQFLIKNNCEGQIHTGKMMEALLYKAHRCDVLVLNGMDLVQWEEHSDEIVLEFANKMTLTADQVLVCTNGFTKRLLPDLDVVAARNQVLVTEPIEGLRLKGCFHAQQGYFYARNIGNRILLGGGRHLDKQNEYTDAFGTTETIQNALTEMLYTTFLPKNIYTQPIKIAHWWSGILGVGAIKKPIVERISKRMSVAVRMGGMGVAIGALVGEEGANLVQ